jgi:lipopolysaccharide transport system ATP-binding protein
MANAVKAEGLGKRYLLSHHTRAPYQTLRESLGRGLRGLFKGGEEREEFWALRGLDLEVPKGQRLGIIGRNGAGKSTLLKLLSRITDPSEGRISLRGRVASLLEVGTGFHPELSGRENIFLNGAILGMRRPEVRAKFDAIVAFAEVERFLDTPVKRYSSGMYMRLAFAVAAHLEPEILIVDEVLAVGDAAFQKKCLGKMAEIGDSGRTLIFVSHQMNAVERLCNRCLVLESGAMVRDTPDVAAAIKGYLYAQDGRPAGEWTSGAPGHACFAPRRLAVTSADGLPLQGAAPVSESLRLTMEADVEQPDPALTMGFALFDEEGNQLFWSYFTDGPEAERPVLAKGRVRLSCLLPPSLLNEGVYRVEMIGGLHYREWILEPGKSPVAVQFELRGGLSESPFWISRRPGILAPRLRWELQ